MKEMEPGKEMQWKKYRKVTNPEKWKSLLSFGKNKCQNRKKDNQTQESTDTLTVSVSETSENTSYENWPL